MERFRAISLLVATAIVGCCFALSAENSEVFAGQRIVSRSVVVNGVDVSGGNTVSRSVTVSRQSCPCGKSCRCVDCKCVSQASSAVQSSPNSQAALPATAEAPQPSESAGSIPPSQQQALPATAPSNEPSVQPRKRKHKGSKTVIVNRAGRTFQRTTTRT